MKKDKKRTRRPKKPTKTHKKDTNHSRVKQKVIVNVSSNGGGSGGGGGFIPFPQQSQQQPVINFIPNSWVDTPFRTIGEKVEANDIRTIGRTAETQTEADPNENEYVESLKRTTQELQNTLARQETDKALKRAEINRKSAETRARNKLAREQAGAEYLNIIERNWKG